MTISNSSLPMGLSAADASVYTDLNSLQGIKQLGKGQTADREQALEQIAKQFESVFLNMMMKSMRDANKAFEDPGMSGSSDMQFYQQMFDQQLTLSLSQRGVGIADALVRQLKQGLPEQAVPELGTREQSTPGQVTPGQGKDIGEYFNTLVNRLVTGSTQDAEAATAETQAESADQDLLSIEDFKTHLMPLAKQAAAQLGIDPAVLLSQAALETGWGQHMIKGQDGQNSFNLFGIKASQDWQGNTAAVSTLEYRDGLPQREIARFRAYDSYAESFQDYVSFIKNQGRYQQALQASGSADAYVTELQRAGYATDPQYANKIMAIADQHFGLSDRDRG